MLETVGLAGAMLLGSALVSFMVVVSREKYLRVKQDKWLLDMARRLESDGYTPVEEEPEE